MEKSQQQLEKEVEQEVYSIKAHIRSLKGSFTMEECCDLTSAFVKSFGEKFPQRAFQAHCELRDVVFFALVEKFLPEQLESQQEYWTESYLECNAPWNRYPVD